MILKVKWLLSIKFIIVIHFGKNPKNGGSPPKDRKFKLKNRFNILLLLNINKYCLIKKILNNDKIIIILILIIL